MDKKMIGIIFFGFLLLIIASFWAYQTIIKSNFSVVIPTRSEVYGMSGKIIQIKDYSIVVEGQVSSTTKTIEFLIDSTTIIKKIVIAITAEQIKSEKPFQPKQTNTTGSFSDLKLNSSVQIVSKQDISKSNSVTASEVNLTNYDLPKTDD